MTQSKKRIHRSSEPKLFRCTGFGNCNMVFTRSEHLARHARKHTGEKPFKCVVPGCERMFSRFDNMIQHTATHNKQQTRNTPSTVIKPAKRPSTNMPQYSTKHTPPLSSPHSGYLSHPPCIHIDTGKANHLPPIYLPVSPATEDMDYFHPTFLPSPNDLGLPPPPADNLASPPFDGTDSSVCSGDWSASPPPSLSQQALAVRPITRRLSQIDLTLPIEALQSQDISAHHTFHKDDIQVTLDEYQALQGMSRLSSPGSSFMQVREVFPRAQPFTYHFA
ncbi:hypothetical protein DM01DRAFT_1410950 [Hesseltinella vesiculosa]|uniref:C2H2-type domain-containing protein n=1 Tax=Hesseltinella vesiculosa TaxID=101127 RepID=A0A1X2G5A7_9FUNG|nr:hypothetical protein DM01DRAFT_1410950 [Hesseltinella vesiculosa]